MLTQSKYCEPSGWYKRKDSRKTGCIIKEKPVDLIVHGGTNDTNVKKSSIKFLKNHHQRLSHFHPSLTAKTRRTSRKP